MGGIFFTFQLFTYYIFLTLQYTFIIYLQTNVPIEYNRIISYFHQYKVSFH